MRRIQFYGIWLYALLCLLLVLLYRFYTGAFETKMLGYNSSLWSALAINLVLLVVSIISLKESRLTAILGIIFSPISTYLFFKSWTEMNYEYLTVFIALPVILLITKMRKSKVAVQPVEEKKIAVQEIKA
jgi:hypothetical protein